MSKNDQKCDFVKCGSNVCGWCQQEKRPSGCMAEQAKAACVAINEKGTLIVNPTATKGMVGLADVFKNIKV